MINLLEQRSKFESHPSPSPFRLLEASQRTDISARNLNLLSCPFFGIMLECIFQPGAARVGAKQTPSVLQEVIELWSIILMHLSCYLHLDKGQQYKQSLSLQWLNSYDTAEKHQKQMQLFTGIAPTGLECHLPNTRKKAGKDMKYTTRATNSL